MNLTGNWQGFYEYGLGYELPFFGQRVKIKSTITDVNGSFTGEIEEEISEFSVHLKSSIKGFTENDFISFVKKYSQKPILNNSSKTIYETGHLEIEHEGFIDEENQSIYGKWMIREIMTDENLGTFEYTTEGIWFLLKVF
jgi:hypothetical protein